MPRDCLMLDTDGCEKKGSKYVCSNPKGGVTCDPGEFSKKANIDNIVDGLKRTIEGVKLNTKTQLLKAIDTILPPPAKGEVLSGVDAGKRSRLIDKINQLLKEEGAAEGGYLKPKPKSKHTRKRKIIKKRKIMRYVTATRRLVR